MPPLAGGIGHRKDSEVGVSHHQRCGRQSADGPFQQLLFAHRLRAVERSPLRPHGQPGFQIVRHQHPQQGPMRGAVLIRPRGIGLAQGWAGSQLDRRAVEEESTLPEGRQEPGGLGRQLLEDVVTAMFHHAKRQSVPRPIIRCGVAGQEPRPAAPGLQAFAGPGPKAGGQAAQQLQHRLLQRSVAFEPLADHQPLDDGQGVDAIVLAQSRLPAEALQEGGGDQPLIQGKHIGLQERA
jgi:hypothetical protein